MGCCDKQKFAEPESFLDKLMEILKKVWNWIIEQIKKLKNRNSG